MEAAQVRTATAAGTHTLRHTIGHLCVGRLLYLLNHVAVKLKVAASGEHQQTDRNARSRADKKKKI